MAENMKKHRLVDTAKWINQVFPSNHLNMNKLKHIIITVAFMVATITVNASDVLSSLMERIDSGLSQKIEVTITADTTDFFELSQHGDKPMIRANNYISAATGLNWYLKYYTGNHLSWNCMTADLPDTLPAIDTPIRYSTHLSMRYYLNYCTYSYSMAFWDWERWEKEIDWMALHGINMPLAINGSAALWRNVLRRLNYPEAKISEFIAGPGFQAWWLMNNLEGWGGPNPDSYYQRDEELQRKIVARMREYGMEPVLPGYSGMLPHDADTELGLNIANPGKWLGYTRPAFLQPTDSEFSRIADIYYDELTRLYGPTRFYSMDPFHEGGNTDGVDLAASGQTIMTAMKRANPEAVWVVQGWQENPRQQMIEGLSNGDMVILDLQAENEPMWCSRSDSFSGHNWLFCMLLNFGGNVGLHGRMQTMADGFTNALHNSPRLSGVGLTMEGIENNPVMYELLCELPWRGDSLITDKWLTEYTSARYGTRDAQIEHAWQLLSKSIYNCPTDNHQQGTTESLFCARPYDNAQNASSWANAKPYYNPEDVFKAAQLMCDVADKFADNHNFVYDLVDITRQAVADKGRVLISRLNEAASTRNKEAYTDAANKFLQLIDLQDSLLGTVTDFRLGKWLEEARACGDTPEEKDRWEWNARVQITTWGNRTASDNGGLRDYAHREWQGLLKDFYRPRWEAWFEARLATWDSGTLPVIDFYAMEEPWTIQHNPYSSQPEGDPIETARRVLATAFAM